MLLGGFSKFGDGVDDGPAGCFVTSAMAKQWKAARSQLRRQEFIVPEAGAQGAVRREEPVVLL